MFTRALMLVAGLVLIGVVDSAAGAEDTSGGRWYVGGGLGAATGLDLCSAFNPGFTTAPATITVPSPTATETPASRTAFGCIAVAKWNPLARAMSASLRRTSLLPMPMIK